MMWYSVLMPARFLGRQHSLLQGPVARPTMLCWDSVANSPQSIVSCEYQGCQMLLGLCAVCVNWEDILIIHVSCHQVARQGVLPGHQDLHHQLTGITISNNELFVVDNYWDTHIWCCIRSYMFMLVMEGCWCLFGVAPRGMHGNATGQAVLFVWALHCAHCPSHAAGWFASLIDSHQLIIMHHQ